MQKFNYNITDKVNYEVNYVVNNMSDDDEIYIKIYSIQLQMFGHENRYNYLGNDYHCHGVSCLMFFVDLWP